MGSSTPGALAAVSMAALLADLACGGARPAPPTRIAAAPAAGATLDQDRDGVNDGVDDCPDQPEDLDDLLDEDGCPEIDADGDSVLDECDRCPEDPEAYNRFEDGDGCWECVLNSEPDGVVFKPNLASLDPSSIAALTHLAQDLVRDTTIGRVAIVARAAPGEPDPRRLSEQRGRTVLEILTSAGVSPARLEIMALGTEPPPADGRDRSFLGRRTALVVVRRYGAEVPLEQGTVLKVPPPRPPPPAPPDSPACPLGPTPSPRTRS